MTTEGSTPTQPNRPTESARTGSGPGAAGGQGATSRFASQPSLPPFNRTNPSGPRRAPGGSGGGGRGRRFYPPRRRVCGFCVDKISYIDYKDISRLRKFVSDRAKIDARRKSGTCARHQRGLSTAIKRARHLAMLPFAPNHIRLNSGRG